MKNIKLSEETRERISQLDIQYQSLKSGVADLAIRAGYVQEMVWAEIFKQVKRDKHTAYAYDREGHFVIRAKKKK
jgi:hypothetical protein